MSEQSAQFDRSPIESYESKEAKTNTLSKSKVRRARIIGIVLLLLSAIVMLILAPASEGG